MKVDQKETKVTNVGFSLVSKLNVKLSFRLISVFLFLNVLYGAAVVIGTVYYSEQTLAQVHSAGPTVFGREINGVTINQLRGKPQGWDIPRPLERFLPSETVSATRFVSWNREQGISWWELLGSVNYNVEFAAEGLMYTLDVGQQMQFLAAILLVLLGGQVYLLIESAFKQAGIIRQTLRPISELAEKAQSLGENPGPFSLGEVQALAGKLDGITAARLDTRIELDSTQDELKNVASAINGLLDRINQAYQMQARFVSDASHELRTPIAAIQGYANLLDRWGKNDPEALEESIAAIKDEAANMKELVEQLLFLARGDNNTMPLQIERFDLAQLGETVLRETQMIDGGHDYEASLDSVFVEADQGLIKQAIRILVDNAIKYTPAGGNIRLVVRPQGSKAEVMVQDEGIGIPPEVVPRIFDRFYRADESRARSTGGTGLGLSIAHWIAERHGGHFEVLSRENLGTRISLVLPAAPLEKN